MGTTKRRIALVSDWYAPRVGGLEHHIRDLAQELIADGNHVEIITATEGPDEVDGVKVHRLRVPMVRGLWEVIRNAETLDAFNRVLDQNRYDVIHAHGIWSALAIAGCCVAQQRGIPSVLSNHSMMKAWEINVARLVLSFTEWGHAPDVVTAVSHAAAADTVRALGRDEVLVVHNAIDLQQWKQPRHPAPTSEVVSVMRLMPRKQPLDLVRAVPLVLEQLDGREAPKFVIVGDGPERAACEAEAARLGVAKYIDFRGMQPRDVVRQLLQRAAIFALPTVREAFSIAALEARAAGLPVVARGGGGISDVIEDGKHGYLTDSTEELAGRIAQLLCNDTQRARMSAAATVGLEQFSWKRIRDTYLGAYRLAEAKKAKHAGLDYRGRGTGLPALPRELSRDRGGDTAAAFGLVAVQRASNLLHDGRRGAAVSAANGAGRRGRARARLPR